MGVHHGFRNALSRLRYLGEKDNVTRRVSSPRNLDGASSVQRLYNLAKRAFSERQVPSQQTVSNILDAMCDVPLEDLGLEEAAGGVTRVSGDSATSDEWPGAITYLKVQEEPGLHLGIFCLPANAVIPLHDHPGMTVLSRLLYGKVHLRSYQWKEEDYAGPLPRRTGVAHLAVDKVLGGSDATSVVFPKSCNIHAFTAITDCAVLDIISPPYDHHSDRDCTFYQEIFPKGVQESEDGFLLGKDGVAVELRCCRPPSSFLVRQGLYCGLGVGEVAS